MSQKPVQHSHPTSVAPQHLYVLCKGEGWSARPGVGSFPNILYTQPSQDGHSFITLEATEVQTYGCASLQLTMPNLPGHLRQGRSPP